MTSGTAKALTVALWIIAVALVALALQPMIFQAPRYHLTTAGELTRLLDTHTGQVYEAHTRAFKTKWVESIPAPTPAPAPDPDRNGEPAAEAPAAGTKPD